MGFEHDDRSSLTGTSYAFEEGPVSANEPPSAPPRRQNMLPESRAYLERRASNLASLKAHDIDSLDSANVQRHGSNYPVCGRQETDQQSANVAARTNKWSKASAPKGRRPPTRSTLKDPTQAKKWSARQPTCYPSLLAEPRISPPGTLSASNQPDAISTEEAVHPSIEHRRQAFETCGQKASTTSAQARQQAACSSASGSNSRPSFTDTKQMLEDHFGNKRALKLGSNVHTVKGKHVLGGAARTDGNLQQQGEACDDFANVRQTFESNFCKRAASVPAKCVARNSINLQASKPPVSDAMKPSTTYSKPSLPPPPRPTPNTVETVLPPSNGLSRGNCSTPAAAPIPPAPCCIESDDVDPYANLSFAERRKQIAAMHSRMVDRNKQLSKVAEHSKPNVSNVPSHSATSMNLSPSRPACTCLLPTASHVEAAGKGTSEELLDGPSPAASAQASGCESACRPSCGIEAAPCSPLAMVAQRAAAVAAARAHKDCTQTTSTSGAPDGVATSSRAWDPVIEQHV